MKSAIGHRKLNWAIKLAFAAALIGAIWWDFSRKDQVDAIWSAFLERFRSAENWAWMALVIVLIPLNWACETLKWHQFVQRLDPRFTFFRAYQAVLAGVAFSLFTPNRVGEYGGRIFFVRRKHQWKAVIANLVGNFSQVILLLGLGGMGAAYFMLRFLKIDPLVVQAVLLLAVGASGALLFAYYNIDLLAPLGKRLPGQKWIRRFAANLKVLREFSNRELSEIFFWSAVRCGVYSSQYFLLLKFFGIQTGILAGFAGIFAIFFVQMSVPLPPITGLLARGNVALHIWGFFGANEVSILASTLALWTLNLVVPAMFGALFLMQTNVARSIGLDDD